MFSRFTVYVFITRKTFNFRKFPLFATALANASAAYWPPTNVQPCTKNCSKAGKRRGITLKSSLRKISNNRMLRCLSKHSRVNSPRNYPGQFNKHNPEIRIDKSPECRRPSERSSRVRHGKSYAAIVFL